ncbi:MAG TPA: hypothetical protein VH934_10790 [Xanthobacteraceae bacterium]|jgi:hypothetical protein
MAKRAARNSRPVEDGRERIEHDLLQEVVDILQKSDFKVLSREGIRNRFSGDFLASRIELGRERRYMMEIKIRADAAVVNDYHARFRNYVRQSKMPFHDFDEFWLIAGQVTDDARSRRLLIDRQLRVLDLQELRKLFPLPRQRARSRTNGRARTRIGKAIEANEKDIQIAIAALILQIDDKLDDLRRERPNSDEAIANRDGRISDYERMRSELENIRKMIVQFTKGELKEIQLVKSVTTFGDGIKSWWHKGHVLILGQAVAAMETFKGKYYGWLDWLDTHDWATSENTRGGTRYSRE